MSQLGSHASFSVSPPPTPRFVRVTKRPGVSPDTQPHSLGSGFPVVADPNKENGVTSAEAIAAAQFLCARGRLTEESLSAHDRYSSTVRKGAPLTVKNLELHSAILVLAKSWGVKLHLIY